MNGSFPGMLWRTARGRFARVAALTAVVAATEGLGFLLLVPLLQQLSSGAGELFGMRLALAPVLAAFVLLVALRSAADLGRAIEAQKLTARIVDDLRHRALAALVGAEWKALARMQQSANRALLVTSIDRVGYAVTLFAELLRTGMGLIALTLAALAVAPLAAVTGLLGATLALALYGGLRRRARTLGEMLSRSYDAIYLRLEETLDALRLIKSFGRERQSVEETGAAFSQLRRAELQYVAISGLARGVMQTAVAAALALAVWLAAERWGIALAILLPLVAIAARAVPLLGTLQQAAQDWNHARPALDETQSLIAHACTMAEPAAVAEAPRLRTAIKIDAVDFGHDAERAALNAICATIPAGSITVLTGPSGCGKSTLADLVGGLLTPDSGQISVDGVALDGGVRTAWRCRVAYVQQEAVLFSGSVRDNLRWAAPDASEADMAMALDAAHAGFVRDLPGGLDCDLGAAGRALSGGERQRIALARALLREPDLLILDEATSALDDASEQAIAAAVAALAGQFTVLVIGHRGALTALSQHRIALNGGRIARG